jgi:hypothetical protein
MLAKGKHEGVIRVRVADEQLTHCVIHYTPPAYSGSRAPELKPVSRFDSANSPDSQARETLLIGRLNAARPMFVVGGAYDRSAAISGDFRIENPHAALTHESCKAVKPSRIPFDDFSLDLGLMSPLVFEIRVLTKQEF